MAAVFSGGGSRQTCAGHVRRLEPANLVGEVERLQGRKRGDGGREWEELGFNHLGTLFSTRRSRWTPKTAGGLKGQDLVLTASLLCVPEEETRDVASRSYPSYLSGLDFSCCRSYGYKSPDWTSSVAWLPAGHSTEPHWKCWKST